MTNGPQFLAKLVISARLFGASLFRLSFQPPTRIVLGVVDGIALLGYHFLEQLLQLHDDLVRRLFASPASQQRRHGRLMDTAATLDFLLRQAAVHEFGDDGLCVHEVHLIAFVLRTQVPMQS